MSRLATGARLVRLFSMGATISYALIGASTGTGAASVGQIVGLAALGVTTHAHAAMINDVVDYPIDRTEPRRADSPLVRGDISRVGALGLAIVSLAVSAALLAVMDASREAWLAWGLAIGLVDLYSLIGKRLKWALISDAVQGVGTSWFVWVGAALTGRATAATVAAMVYVAGYVIMVNGVHGTVRDLANDAAQGAKTTALMFGANVDEDGTVVLPGAFVAWAVVLQLWLLAAATSVYLLSREAMGQAAAVGALVSGLALTVALVWTGAAALGSRSDRERMLSHGTWHLVFGLALLVGVVLWIMPWWTATVALVAFISPPKLFGWAVALEQS
jgi:4-hydroxybenzoate polyprenyltransferase